MGYKTFASMDIAVIGSGRVGSALALHLAEAGHHVTVGVRDAARHPCAAALDGSAGITVAPLEDAALGADVIFLATPAAVMPEVAYYLGDVRRAVILSAACGLVAGPVAYAHSIEALARITGCAHVVRMFATSAYSLHLPAGSEKPELYLAGDSPKAKAVASSLATDLGMTTVHDLGVASAIPLLDEVAACWISMQVPARKMRPAVRVQKA